MGNLTEQGYDAILKRVIEMKVPVPHDKTIGEMKDWIAGYAECMAAVVRIIEDLRDSNLYGR